MAYFLVSIIIFGGYHIFVESTVQGTELINIKVLSILNTFILLMRLIFTVPRK